MSQYHLSVKMHGRQGGKRAETRAAKGRPRKGPESSVAAASYRSGNTLIDERTGTTHRYSRADRVKHTEILAPTDAPQWATDRAQLWNAVERREKRKDAQLFREFEIGLPVELNLDQQVNLLRGWIAQQITTRGAVADVAVHLGRDGNPHAHIMVTLRGLSAEGWGSQKLREWEDRSALENWRSSWAEHANQALARAGSEARIDHRSYSVQDADLPEELRREPMLKIGPGGRGKSRDLENQRIRRRNAARAEAAARFRADRDRATASLEVQPQAIKPKDRGFTHPHPEPDVMPSPALAAVVAAAAPARERTPQRAPAPAQHPKSSKKLQKKPVIDRIMERIGDFALDPLGIKRRRVRERKQAEIKRAQDIARDHKIYEAWTRRIKSDPDIIAGDLHWAIAGRGAFTDVFDHKALGLPATTSDAMRKRICEFAMEVRSERERAEYVARARVSSTPEPRMQEIKRTRSRDTSALDDAWWLSSKGGPER